MTEDEIYGEIWHLIGPFWMLDENAAPIPAPSMRAWLDWRRVNLNLHVADEIAGDSRVSTVFITSPMLPLSGGPMFFETMIFGGRMDGIGCRYATRDEALIGHTAAVRAVTMTAEGVPPTNDPKRQNCEAGDE